MGILNYSHPAISFLMRNDTRNVPSAPSRVSSGSKPGAVTSQTSDQQREGGKDIQRERDNTAHQ